MKFTCNQQTLSKALNTVSKAVSSRTTIPILKSILIKAESDNSLTLSATDLDLSIDKKIDVSVESPGSTVVSAKLFLDIIKKLPNNEIEIEEIENNNIVIRCLASEFVIVGQSAEEFPNMGEVDMEKQISIDKEIFKDMIKRTSFSASIDEGKGIITGVLIE